MDTLRPRSGAAPGAVRGVETVTRSVCSGPVVLTGSGTALDGPGAQAPRDNPTANRMPNNAWTWCLTVISQWVGNLLRGQSGGMVISRV
jgi:hypothetical protein